MDVPKVFVVGIGLLGAYAAYRMLSSEKLLPGPHGELPPGTPSQPIDPSGLVLLGDPLSMKKGQWYRGRLELPPAGSQPVPPFNAQGTTTDIARALSVLGFADATVMLGSDAKGFPSGILREIKEGTRFFQARWSQDAMQLPRPLQLTHMWVTKAPT